jgi:quercetin dioxygenase-like cupin family protein
MRRRFVSILALLCLLSGVAPALERPARAQLDETPMPENGPVIFAADGATVSTLAYSTGDALESAAPHILLERLTLAAGESIPEHTSTQPELIYVETGSVSIKDNFGFSSKAAEDDSVTFNAGASYVLANKGKVTTTVLRLRLEAESVEQERGTPGVTPVASPIAASDSVLLIDQEVDAFPATETTFFIASAEFEPGSSTGKLQHAGPIGIYVDEGELTVLSPSGVKGQLEEGTGVVLPEQFPLVASNDAEDGVVVYVVGAIKTTDTLLSEIVPTSTPDPTSTATAVPTNTAIPSNTPVPTDTPVPTETAVPTNTRVPTATRTPSPTPDRTTKQGTVLNLGETWVVDGAEMTIKAEAFTYGRGFNFEIVYRNTSASRVDFTVPDGPIRIYDDLRAQWDCGNNGNKLVGDRVILDPGEAGQWLDLYCNEPQRSYTANVFISISGVGAIDYAVWGFTYDVNRLLTLPPGMADPARSDATGGQSGESDDGSPEVDQLADDALPTSGQLAYAMKADGHWDLYRYNFAKGKSRRLTNSPNADDWAPAFSHDGKRLAYLSDVSGSNQVWLMDLNGDGQRQLTNYPGPGSVYYVAWLHDDSQLAVTIKEDSGAHIMVASAETGALDGFMPTWSSFPTFAPDGNFAYVTWANDDTDVLLGQQGTGYVSDISASSINEDAPNMDASGRKVAYNVGDKGGRYIEYFDFSTSERGSLPQMGDDSNPVWSPGGSAIACVVDLNGDQQIYVRTVDGQSSAMVPIAPHTDVWYLAWSS